MSIRNASRQPDLFAEPNASRARPPMPADFVERIRKELTATLALARAAAQLPWKDPTAATLAELRFNSIAGWLPDAEAERLRASFAVEMQRLWAAAAALAAD
jgi:hypothetical protein